MAEYSFPFVGSQVSTEVQHRAFYSHLGDGVINASTGEVLKLVADGSSTLRLQPGEGKVRSFYYYNDALKAFNLADPALEQPAAGQSRLDYLVLRVDMAAKTLRAVLVPGTPSTNPAYPNYNGPTGSGYQGGGALTYDVPIWSWRWTGEGVRQEELVDRRPFLGPTIHMPEAGLLPEGMDIGTRVIRVGSGEWLRQLFEDNSVGWVNRTADQEQRYLTGEIWRARRNTPDRIGDNTGFAVTCSGVSIVAGGLYAIRGVLCHNTGRAGASALQGIEVSLWGVVPPLTAGAGNRSARPEIMSITSPGAPEVHASPINGEWRGQREELASFSLRVKRLNGSVDINLLTGSHLQVERLR